MYNGQNDFDHNQNEQNQEEEFMNYEHKGFEKNEMNRPEGENERRGHRGHRCPDCPYEEPRCGSCERRGGKGRGEHRREDHWTSMDNRSPEQHGRPEGHEPQEGQERREFRAPHSLLGKLALCGRLAEHRRGMRRGQMHILRILEENGSMSQRVLQELLHIQPGSMSEIATKLETAGLIARERSEEDKRRVTVSITDQGKELLAAHPNRDTQTLEPLTEEEQKTLEELLDQLIAAWGPEAGQGRRGPGHGPGGPGGFGPGRGPKGPKGPRPPLHPHPELL